eukprot:7662765-Alexandrium_andersonii.AAC.1
MCIRDSSRAGGPGRAQLQPGRPLPAGAAGRTAAPPEPGPRSGRAARHWGPRRTRRAATAR